MIIGDHNTEPHEASIAGWLVGEDCFHIPENEEEVKQPTRRGGKRHFDYAIVAGLLQVENRYMVRTTSDHDCVQYDVAWKDWENLRVRPSFNA